MPRRFRGLVGALAACALLAASAAPAAAYSGRIAQDPHSVPVLLDAFILRPVGFSIVVGGFGLFCLSAPVVAITRPMGFGKIFKTLVINPSRFTFVDSMGYHPDRFNGGYGVIE